MKDLFSALLAPFFVIVNVVALFFLLAACPAVIAVAAISARHIGNDCGRVRGFRRCFIAVLAKERARMTDEIECLIGIVLLFVMYVAWIFESDDRDE